MNTLHKLNELRAAIRQQRQAGRTVALVPTMGNLHAGHIQLVKRAHELADYVVTSIFVNPMQFGANEDFGAYPRTLEKDQEKLVDADNHLLFAPSVAEVYPNGLDAQTQVSVPALTDLHCGASRPGHFTGVATVVSKLFNMVQPDYAVFGEKDFQQLAVIRKLVRDLCFPIKIEGVATLRESDGLAMSSRNGYLSAEARTIAPRLYQTLQQMADAIRNGERNYDQLAEAGRTLLLQNGFQPDYFNIVNSLTLQPAAAEDQDVTLLVAASLGTTRLIDNINLKLDQ